MEPVRELCVICDEAALAELRTTGEAVQQTAPKNRKAFPKRLAAVLLAAVLVIGAAFAAVEYGIPAIRYYSACNKFTKGEYAEANEIFAALGDYRDSRLQREEAEKGIVYLKAVALLEQGNRDEAQVLFEQIGAFRDAPELLQGICDEALYEQAVRDMADGLYIAAREGFETLENYRDAAQKAEECRRLHDEKVSEKTYGRACRMLANGDPVGAYREFASIPIKDYKDTADKIDEIFALFEKLAEQYADTGERGVLLACLRMAEEINGERGAALREKLIPAEEFVPDQSFYFIDTSHITRFYYGTPKEEFASVVIYMLLHGQMDFALMSNMPVEYEILVDKALQGVDLAGEILPGYGATYNPQVYVGDNYVTFNLTRNQEYSEFQRTQNIKAFKAFCMDSVRELAEKGLLSTSMSRKQRAEVIFNWVGFFLTYDKALLIHDVGIAVRDKKGVCEAFAALYNRMCNLADVPAYGQIGMTRQGAVEGRHIWTFHVDEDGSIFYSDSTWGDSYTVDFSVEQEQEPTIELFMESYLDRCLKAAIAEMNGNPGAAARYEDVYFWSKTLWGTHEAERTTEEIMAFHAKLLGQEP